MASKDTTEPASKRRRLSPPGNAAHVTSTRKPSLSRDSTNPDLSTSASESDVSSVLSSSSDEDDEEIVTLSSAKKPVMRFRPAPRGRDGGGGEEGALQERLASFLPALRRANEELVLEGGVREGFEILESEEDREGEGGEVGETGEGADEEEGKGRRKEYISMELGLGVLEERDAADESSSEEEEEEDGKRDVMGKLMGSKGAEPAKKPGIEEVA